jgi:hypothetical protein
VDLPSMADDRRSMPNLVNFGMDWQCWAYTLTNKLPLRLS